MNLIKCFTFSLAIVMVMIFPYLCFRLDGFIVCEEFKDILLAAWDEEQEIIKAREEEVRVLERSSRNSFLHLLYNILLTLMLLLANLATMKLSKNPEND